MRWGWFRPSWAAVILLATACGFARADGPAQVRVPRADVLSLRAGDVPVGAMTNLLAGDAPFPAARHFVIQLDGPMTPARATSLAAANIRLCGYLPTGFFIADLSKSTPGAVRALGFIPLVAVYRDEWKMDEALLAPPGRRVFATKERQALAAKQLAAVRVWMFAGESVRRAGDAVRAAKGTVLLEETVDGAATLTATLPFPKVASLAGVAGVQFVEELPEFTERSNSTVRWVVQSAIPPDPNPVTPLYSNGLIGTGQVLGFIDGWLAYQHCSFLDPVNPIGPAHRKILAYNTAFGYNVHGTHVAGTAVGDAGDWTDTRGVAYGARLVFNTWPNVSESSVYDHFDLHRTQGAFVHSNSWGNNATNAYDGTCRAIDSIQWLYPDQLILFAVADASVIRNPENAKSCLAVTATGGWPNINTICSPAGAGPTIDGRRKPEVAAPGCGTLSSVGETGCSVAALSGTSMATPAVAGVALLTRQYFTDGYYPDGAANPGRSFTPSGSLIKAAVINSAVDMTGVTGYPSNSEGWGRVLADYSLYFPGDVRRLVVRDAWNNTGDALHTGEQASFGVHVGPASGQQLRVTLAYADAPAVVGAAIATVNNLDLQVTAPSGLIYWGNFFSGGESQYGGTPDALNTVEQVHISNPQPGDWTITILAPGVNAGAQGYAVVVTGDVSDNPACIGDYNQSGGAPDDADVAAFFLDWSAGDARADVNQSGGTPDDADVAVFFAHWSDGC